jgi:hypothetical protein
MSLEECLRAGMAEVLSAVDAAVPELTRPQSWASRLARFLAAMVV